jgi:hypothetical protein
MCESESASWTDVLALGLEEGFPEGQAVCAVSTAVSRLGMPRPDGLVSRLKANVSTRTPSGCPSSDERRPSHARIRRFNVAERDCGREAVEADEAHWKRNK